MLFVGVSLAGVIILGMLHSQHLIASIDHNVGPYTDALAQHALDNPDPELWQKMAGNHGVIIVVVPADGDPVGFDAQGQPLSVDDPSLTHHRARSERVSRDGTSISFYWPTKPDKRSHFQLMGGLLVMLSAVVGLAFWYLHRQLKPLAWLHAGVEAVALGDFDHRAPVVRRDEIGQIAEAFNVMVARVGEMIGDRERLLGDVSHELRSPIARMKVALEFMPEGKKRDSLVRDLREMEDLISVLLEREALRSRTQQLQGETFDLTALIKDVIATFADRETDVHFHADSVAKIDGDRELIKLLVQNLIDNAVKFSHPDSQPVDVKLEISQDQTLIRVLDDGIGIPVGREKELFEPFVKVNRARGHGVGYGIGLNLCQRIVQLHGGTIELCPRQPRGVEVVVKLPRSTGT